MGPTRVHWLIMAYICEDFASGRTAGRRGRPQDGGGDLRADMPLRMRTAPATRRGRSARRSGGAAGDMAVAPAPPRLAARHDAPAAERGGIDAAASDVSRSVVARRRSEHECGAAERAGREPPAPRRSIAAWRSGGETQRDQRGARRWSQSLFRLPRPARRNGAELRKAEHKQRRPRGYRHSLFAIDGERDRRRSNRPAEL